MTGTVVNSSNGNRFLGGGTRCPRLPYPPARSAPATLLSPLTGASRRPSAARPAARAARGSLP